MNSNSHSYTNVYAAASSDSGSFDCFAGACGYMVAKEYAISAYMKPGPTDKAAQKLRRVR